LVLPFVVAAILVVAGLVLDSNYQRSTSDPVYVRGTVVDFERHHARQVYPILEFTDENGRVHRVVNSSQQAIIRLATGDAVPIAYSRFDPQQARIDTFWFNHRWVIGGLVFAITLVFGALIRRRSG
jgi:translation initiation factor IF-1